MKSIKASPQEYDELGFNPKDGKAPLHHVKPRGPPKSFGASFFPTPKSQELVKQIAESYLFLVRANKDEVMDGSGQENWVII